MLWALSNYWVDSVSIEKSKRNLMSSFSAKLEGPISLFSSSFRVLTYDCVMIPPNLLPTGGKDVSLADPVCMWLGGGRMVLEYGRRRQ